MDSVDNHMGKAGSLKRSGQVGCDLLSTTSSIPIIWITFLYIIYQP